MGARMWCDERPCLWTWQRMMQRTELVWQAAQNSDTGIQVGGRDADGNQADKRDADAQQAEEA